MTDVATGQRFDVKRVLDEVLDDRCQVPPPRATYRLQLNHTFTFGDATRIVPYLARLGVSHVYASPIFKAAPGSMHGYDVVDYEQINPEIGTRAEFDTFVATLHEHGLGLILDFVPNHMGIGNGENRWWLDVLENGRHSPYAAYFDIDWEPVKRELQGKVLLPILGDQYGAVLERGELTLSYAAGAFTVHYWETPLPIAPSTYPTILRRALPAIKAELPEDDLDRLEYESIIIALDRLPEVVGDDAEAIHTRQREQVVAKHRLAVLIERSAPIGQALAATVAAFAGNADDPRSFDALDELLREQPYRLAFWRVAAEEINYRRFFAINTLAAIRQEEPAVFAASHGLLVELLAGGQVDGVRIDHPDGLWDPAGYLRELQRAYLVALVQRRAAALALNEDDWSELLPSVEAAVAAALDRIAANRGTWPLYVLVEKILEHGETLPDDWAVAGTVGYEFAHAATSLFVDADQRRAFDLLYQRFTGERHRFADLVYEKKYGQLRDAFPSEANVLTNALNRISEHNRRSRDFTLNDLRDALRQVIASFPVYRTYTTCAGAGVAERDRRYIEAAIAQAKRRTPRRDVSVYDFLANVLLLGPDDGFDHDAGRALRRCHFAMRFQQLTGPVMAKGLEDTAFYIFNRLVSLNEVGGDPSRFGTSVEEFHRLSRARQRRWPHAMSTSSTHDTKRGEDVRARIDVLSEVPTEWRAALNRWTRLTRRHRTKVEGTLSPHKDDLYLIFQTLIGTWPLVGTPGADYVERIQAYAVKALREASVRTNWLNPNEPYETALTAFIAGILDPRRGKAFRDDFVAFHNRIAGAGLVNALAQQVLKLAAPGVPDIYQGTELWDDSLVDPDNRRPVDFAARGKALRALDGECPTPERAAALFAQGADGRLKLAVTQAALTARAACPPLFADGDYQPLTVTGEAARHVVAFARRHGDDAAVVAVPRLVAGLAGLDATRLGDPALWADTRIELAPVRSGTYRDVFTGQRHQVATDGEEGAQLSVGELFAALPVALLVRDAASEEDA